MLASFADEAVTLDGSEEFLELLGYVGSTVSEGYAPSRRALQDAASGSVRAPGDDDGLARQWQRGNITGVYTVCFGDAERLETVECLRF